MGIANADRARQQGSFEHDLASGNYTLHWKNKQDMEGWRLAEEERLTIEFIKTKLKSAPPDRAPFWTTTQIYVCSRALSGGRSHYVRKHNWKRAVPIKKSGCKCRLTIKFYPNTEEVLGMYTDEHSHEVGNKNSRFTRLQVATRLEIEHLRLGVEPRKVVCRFLVLSPAIIQLIPR